MRCFGCLDENGEVRVDLPFARRPMRNRNLAQFRVADQLPGFGLLPDFYSASGGSESVELDVLQKPSRAPKITPAARIRLDLKFPAAMRKHVEELRRHRDVR